MEENCKKCIHNKECEIKKHILSGEITPLRCWKYKGVTTELKVNELLMGKIITRVEMEEGSFVKNNEEDGFMTAEGIFTIYLTGGLSISFKLGTWDCFKVDHDSSSKQYYRDEVERLQKRIDNEIPKIEDPRCSFSIKKECRNPNYKTNIGKSCDGNKRCARYIPKKER